MNSYKFRSLLRRRIFIIFLIIIQFVFLMYTMVSTSRTSTLLTTVMIVMSVLVTLYILSKKDKGGYKLTWVIMILIFPLFGGLFYLIFHLQTTQKSMIKGIETIENKSRSILYLPKDSYKEALGELSDYSHQITYLQKFAGFPIYNGTETKYLFSGEEKFEFLCQELKKAKNYIFLEYFIISEGKMWNTILDILKSKAKEGVIVRIIYDDMGCFLKLPKNYAAYLKTFSIECIVFNPFRPVISTIQNNRDHRKIAVIDGIVAFTGGVNLADEYINEIDKYGGHWKDSAVMIKGKGAWSFTVMFLQMWELISKQKERYRDFFPNEAVKTDEKGFVQPYTDSPVDKENVGEHVYLKIINNAKKYLYISTPYLIIDDSIVSALCLAAKSGVDVRIITPFKADKWIVHVTTRSYYRELIKAGVKIYEYSKGFVHSKTFVSDDRVATVGTANLDYRSLYLNFECGVVMYETSAVAEVKKDFENTFGLCHLVELKECKRSFFIRLLQDIMRIFAPLM
ncbi:MAG: cardiolipin synthase [Ruminococcaceae bacterium]|nr:cardiolipin synthase [Oscillospiraceae bacterium]